MLTPAGELEPALDFPEEPQGGVESQHDANQVGEEVDGPEELTPWAEHYLQATEVDHERDVDLGNHAYHQVVNAVPDHFPHRVTRFAQAGVGQQVDEPASEYQEKSQETGESPGEAVDVAKCRCRTNPKEVLDLDTGRGRLAAPMVL